MLKTTPLTATHAELGAKMAEFAGYNMPIIYSNIQEEHNIVRNAIGMFDVSHMGEFIVRGKEAVDLVNWVTSNNAAKLEIGQAQYSCLPNEQGGIVDDLLVYRLPQDMCAEGEQAFLLVVNASNIDKDWAWINLNNKFDTRLINISDETGLLAIQGPKTTEALQSLTSVDLSAIKYYHFEKGTFAGVDNVIISATGYTGSGGFEIYADNQQLPAIWDAIMEAGKPYGILPVGLGARDTLRLEMGFCLYGNDIDDTTSPIEAGLGWITKTKKGPFISQPHFAAQREQGVDNKLVGFYVHDRRVPRQGYLICDESGNPIGRVTSGTQSPSLDKPIGMGYVPLAYAAKGSKIQIDTGRKMLEAEVTSLPFYQPVS
ncbi:MAG: glycine cleavage system aminomethyltransferase GcvT [Saprospiraceae bacterium]|nr:glycine cleavage system aminomethyltransferase GcvT [Saprospiraceae bacterium]